MSSNSHGSFNSIYLRSGMSNTFICESKMSLRAVHPLGKSVKVHFNPAAPQTCTTPRKTPAHLRLHVRSRGTVGRSVRLSDEAGRPLPHVIGCWSHRSLISGINHQWTPMPASGAFHTLQVGVSLGGHGGLETNPWESRKQSRSRSSPNIHTS